MSTLGIVTALHNEAFCLSNQKLPVQENVPLEYFQLYIAGMGSDNARVGTQSLIAHGAKAIISWGTAGALSADLEPGDVVIPNIIEDRNGQSFSISQQWHQNLIGQLKQSHTVSSKKLIQSDSVIATRNDKQKLKEISGAIAVDMESATIAAIAAQHNIPMLAIRTIVDPASTTIPDIATRNIDEFGRTRLLPLLIALTGSPTNIPALISLGRDFQKAQKTLQEIATLADKQFFLPADLKE